MSKFLCQTQEVYRVSSEAEAARLIEEAKSDRRFTLLKSSTEYNLKLKKDSKEKSTTNNKDSKESTKKNNTTESKTNKIQNQGTENGQDTSSNKNEITVVVKKGETLKEVCDELQDKGVVKSSESMRHFMVEKGYDSFLHAGSFNVKKGMSEDEIGKIFSK